MKLPSLRSVASWAGSIFAGSVAGLIAEGVAIGVGRAIHPAGYGAATVASAAVGAVAGSVSQGVTAVTREDQKKCCSTASVLKVIGVPVAAAGTAALTGFLATMGMCVGEVNAIANNGTYPIDMGFGDNTVAAGNCGNTFNPLQSSEGAWIAASAAISASIVGAAFWRCIVDKRCSVPEPRADYQEIKDEEAPTLPKPGNS